MKLSRFIPLVVAATLLFSCASKPAETKKPASTSNGTTKTEPAVPEVPKVELLFNESAAVKDTGSKAFNCTSAKETVNNMTVGWNLGNTMDAIGGSSLYSETAWGQPKTTKAMIDGLAASGIKTIRIPVSWAAHMDKKNYTVKADWMNRVKEIVDWAIEDDMYVILNCHHDNYGTPNKLPAGFGYYPNSKNKIESERWLLNLWTQISLAFNNGYDEHLIFETMNEPRLCGTGHEWWFDANAEECRDAANVLNEYNQLVVDTIRASGGNNEKRFIMCPGLQASPDSALASAFKMPTDNAPDKLIVSVHMYSPYTFAMQSPGEKTFTSRHQAELAKTFKNLDTKFIQAGYPVVVGEMGAVNKKNTEERVKWFDCFIRQTRKYGMTACLWDNGAWEVSGDDYNEKFGFYNRNTQTWYFPELIEAMIEATK
ncbi:MAG: glycoside hydrolase family 5 protein [Treponema sp.]|nr:glycoside hydrolase family 5 protein [Treponema sp.]